MDLEKMEFGRCLHWSRDNAECRELMGLHKYIYLSFVVLSKKMYNIIMKLSYNFHRQRDILQGISLY